MNTHDQRCRDFEPLLAMAMQRGVDRLDPDAVERLATHLDRCERCAAVLRDTPAAPAAVPPLPINLPGAAEWDRLWLRIEHGTQVAPGAARTLDVVRFRRFAAAAGLAAAAVLMMLIAIVGRLDPARDAAELRIAPGGAVRIDGIEVADGTSFVLTIGSEDAPVIWVLDDRNEGMP